MTEPHPIGPEQLDDVARKLRAGEVLALHELVYEQLHPIVGASLRAAPVFDQGNRGGTMIVFCHVTSDQPEAEEATR